MEIKKRKQLPYGISNFEKIRTKNYVYIDKTRYIEQILDEEITNVIEDNLKTDFGRLQMLLKNEKNRARLIQIAENDGITSNVLSRFSLDELHDNNSFVSLLFYMGLLTIDRCEGIITYLKIPNYTIRTIFLEYIEQLTIEENFIGKDKYEIEEI
jgi:hypothetical protein